MIKGEIALDEYKNRKTTKFFFEIEFSLCFYINIDTGLLNQTNVLFFFIIGSEISFKALSFLNQNRDSCFHCYGTSSCTYAVLVFFYRERITLE